MADVFISFVHEEKEIAEAVQALLKQELHLADGVFLSEDRSQVYAGDQWLVKIREALDSAKVVVLLFSMRAANRPWVNFEAGAAWLAATPIIPCCYGNMRKDRLPHPYSTIQALDLPAEVDYLLASVHHHLGLPGNPPRAKLLSALLEPPKPGSLGSIIRDAEPRRRLKLAIEAFIDIDGTFVVKRKRSDGTAQPSPAPAGTEPE